MKFSEKLGAHLTPEWRKQYISYKDLKSMIVQCTENAPVLAMTSKRIVDDYYANFAEEFFFECDKELRKVNTFYAEKLAEASRRNESLGLRLDMAVAEFRLKKTSQSRYTVRMTQIDKGRKGMKKDRLNDLKNTYSEFYLSLVLLQNYKVLNHTGFRKILKKYDKLLHTASGMKWFDENVETAYFFKNDDINDIIEEVEFNVTEYLENGDRVQAMKRLRVPPLEEAQEMGTVFRVGFYIGALVVLLTIILMTNISEILSESEAIYGLLLFRGPFYIVLYLFLLGINVLTWRQYGVNHILIFEIDPRKRVTYSHLLELHGFFGVIWALSVLCFINAKKFGISPYWFPLILPSLMFIFLITPCDICHRSGRVWLLKLMGRVCTAPFQHVGFADFWFGDQLNSLAQGLVDIKSLVCFYVFKYTSSNFHPSTCMERDHIGNAIILCLPPWFRFAQCLRRYHDTGLVHPFLVNAGKYFTSFPTVVCATLMKLHEHEYATVFENPFVWYWLGSHLIQSIYCYSWDVLRDFGLFQTFTCKHLFLRDQLMYSPCFYYFVIVENLILRFFWAIAFYLVSIRHLDGLNVGGVGVCLEIIRRYIWNYVRLENEHLYNVGRFRAVRDIFLAPIDATRKSEDLEKLMDDKDGVKNRKKKDN